MSLFSRIQKFAKSAEGRNTKERIDEARERLTPNDSQQDQKPQKPQAQEPQPPKTP